MWILPTQYMNPANSMWIPVTNHSMWSQLRIIVCEPCPLSMLMPSVCESLPRAALSQVGPSAPSTGMPASGSAGGFPVAHSRCCRGNRTPRGRSALSERCGPWRRRRAGRGRPSGAAACSHGYRAPLGSSDAGPGTHGTAGQVGIRHRLKVYQYHSYIIGISKNSLNINCSKY